MSNENEIVRDSADMKIGEVARRLNRGYTWVYDRLEKIAEYTYRYKGVIFIRERGLKLLQDMNATAPKRGRPRKESVV